MPQSEDKPQDPLSKTQRKKDMLALQAIGKTLVDLPAAQLAKIPLPDILLKAIETAHALKSHEALRRHMQYIGKIMREVDTDMILTTLAAVKYTNAKQVDDFHQVEAWRDQLVAEGDAAVQRFLHAYPQVDRQTLRQLVRRAQHDHTTGKNTGAETKLFRFLREFVS